MVPHERASERAWRSARTFDELCVLGARFAAGELDCFPGWGFASLDPESEAIAPVLAALNRAGFLTLASQPGVAAALDHDAHVRRQRAFVCGFATPTFVAELARIASRSIAVRTHRDPRSRGRRIAVSTRGGVPYAFAGHNAIADELACFADPCDAAAVDELARAAYVSIVDLRWGRAAHLWTQLACVAERARGSIGDRARRAALPA